jgi:steroid 5-alpha reductase family enzyme
MQASIFWIALLCIVVSYMNLWYGLALYTKRYDVVDSAWGLGFVLVAWVSLGLRSNFSSLQVVSATLVSLWGLRLFGHIANRNWRKSTEDHRYRALRAQWGSKEKQKAYTNVFLLQGLLIMIVSAPMVAIAFANHSANLVTYIGWLIWLGGIVFEAIADRQLAVFLQHRPKDSHQLMDSGLWRYSRHPNYFGEVTTWWGAAVVATSVGGWWGIVGAFAITLLITKVSGIPPLEKHYDGNKDYEAYRKRTSVLIPLLQKKSSS